MYLARKQVWPFHIRVAGWFTHPLVRPMRALHIWYASTLCFPRRDRSSALAHSTKSVETAKVIILVELLSTVRLLVGTRPIFFEDHPGSRSSGTIPIMKENSLSLYDLVFVLLYGPVRHEIDILTYGVESQAFDNLTEFIVLLRNVAHKRNGPMVFMLEFMFGIVTGWLIFRPRWKTRTVGIQVGEVWGQPVRSQPISIQTGSLKDFWT
jgi:hypothetical protein